MSVEVFIKDDNGKAVASGAKYKNGGEITVKDVTSGSHLFVEIIQSEEKGEYKLTVE